MLFVGEIRKLAAKQNFNAKEYGTVKKAVLIAALSSSHSWKTSKYLNNYCDLDKKSLSEEFIAAQNENWKFINENDIEEVVNCADKNGSFNPYALSMWFYNVMDDKTRFEYSEVFNKMKKEFAYGLEPMEKRV